MSTNGLERLVRSIPLLFENPKGTDRPLWRDISVHQGNVDFSVMVANAVQGVAIRAALSWGYKDPNFARNWAEAGRHGLYRTSYFVVFPDQDILRQADNWYSVHPTIDVIPRVIDLEVDRSIDNNRIADAVYRLSNTVFSRDGVRPIIYSRANLVNKWLADWSAAVKNAHYWWLAEYLSIAAEHAGPPTIPSGVNGTNIILHQTSDHKLDFPGEADSKMIDWNRWMIGDEQRMHSWIRNEWGNEDGTPPVTPPTEEPVTTDSKWKGKARGLKVDTLSTAWNFIPAFEQGISFLVYELNPRFGMYYNSWVQGLQQAYDKQVPVVGVYNCDVNMYDRLIDFAYWDDLEANVEPRHDEMWLHLESLLKSKWINALVINYVNFDENGNPDKPLPAPHVQLIIRESMKRFRLRAPMVHNPVRIKQVLIQIDERIIRNRYPDLGLVLGDEPYCLAGLDTMPAVKAINNWSEFENHLPPNQVAWYGDGKLHDNPPISYTDRWAFWKFADFNDTEVRNGFLSQDFKRADGLAIMGGVIFNGDRNQLSTFLDMPVPDYTDGFPPIVVVPPDEPEVPPVVNENITEAIITAIRIIITALQGIIAQLTK